MPQLANPNSPTDTVLEVRRTGLIAFLFGILRPNQARAAAITADGLKLTFATRTAAIAFWDLKEIKIETRRRRSRMHILHASGETTTSGLARNRAEAFVASVEIRRADWWRKALAPRVEVVRFAHGRLALLRDPPAYVTKSAVLELKRVVEEAADGLRGCLPDTLARDPDFRMLKAIQAFLEAPERFRTRANETFIENELVRSKEFLGRIEARPLTDEQRRAVVTDEDRNLVVAAAGSGKTSVIVAKTGWLIRKGYRRPSELLLLAFARDARKEMEDRVRKRLGKEAGQDITVRTFHSLGMAIIGEAEGRKPSLAKSAESDRALFDLLKDIIAELLRDRELAEILLTWFGEHFALYRSEHDFSSWGEYWDYIRKHDIRSLKGDTVRSFEECEIANFLYLHGVPYEYEAQYEHDTATSRHSQYRPDFHLPEAGIYIEHFGLDANGNTAPFVDQQKYLESMAWKLQKHEEHGTTLIQTFSHEHASGTLIRNLEDKLAEHGVTFSPIPSERTFAILEEQGRIDPFTRLVATFLQHFKGAQLSFEDVAQRAGDLGDPGRTAAFLAVFRPIFDRYQETLANAGEIDFHDMIGKATEHVESGQYESPFGYILVDEFQDISPGRARLLKALLDQSSNNRLFAVGDDWQAIYRFGGADISIMREFRERFGNSERIVLETTFRCNDRIAALATAFVLKNPAQIRKTVRAVRRADGPAVHVGLPGEENRSLLREALDRVATDANRHDGTSSVLLLGRYRHTGPKNMPGITRRYPGLRVSFMTVHGSKGLEADYVVVPGLCSGKYGFPAEIVDDPLLDLVLATPEHYPNAEERRLFYVAVTRARRQAFLLADGGPPSPFILELIEGKYDVNVFGQLPGAAVPCPVCKKGHLKRRENARGGGIFHGCSNWPLCEHRQRPCPACGEGLPERSGTKFRCRDCGQAIQSCPRCDGWLETRMGKFGRFLGCSNYPACEFTRNIRKRGAGHAQ